MHTHWTITEADRDAAGNIMTQAERRADDRNPATPPAAETQHLAPQQAPRRAVRARRPEDRLRQAAAPSAPSRIGRVELAALVCAALIIIAAFGVLGRAAPAREGMTVTIRPTPAPAPTAAPAVPISAAQDAYAAPDGTLLGTIPVSATLRYQDSRAPGWGGIRWDGGVVWVRTGQALAALPDLAEPTPAPPPPAWIPPPAAAQVEEPTPIRSSTHERPHEEEGPRPPIYFSQPVEPR